MIPLINIKIPTYNCAEYLKETLDSIFNQENFDIDLLDIEVIDDCSTMDEPQDVIRTHGRGRTKFYRNEKNIGATMNFNKCIERSNCEWIHILHGDDYIEKSFYAEILKLIETYPNRALYATQVNYVDEKSALKTPVIENSVYEAIELNYHYYLHSTYSQFASTVFNVSLAKEIGNFDLELIHLSDRDMFLKLVLKKGGVFFTKALSNYRIFEGNDTSRLVKSGENIRDLMRFYNKYEKLNLLTEKDKFFNIEKFTRRQITSLKNRESVLLNLRVFNKLVSFRYKILFFVGITFDILKNLILNRKP